jgi:uncharacterized protein YukE
MADVRTLKLNLLADVSQFGKSLSKADTDTKSFSGKIKGYSKVAAKAFAAVGVAAGVMAVKIGVDGVKAAIEDEVSQKKLAKTLQNVTKATDKQIAATEDYITSAQLQYGISDTKLRPALEILARRTKDVTEAQKLNNLAIDIAAGTGKDLETVATALGKAYGGNLTSLKKLGVPLDENIIKTKDFDAATKALTDTFGGSAQANTKTYQGQLNILNERWGELKEGIGQKAIPILKRLLEQVNLVAIGFSGEDQKKGLTNKVRALSNDLDGKSGGVKLGESLKDVADSFGQLFGALSGDKAKSGNDNLENLAEAFQNVANGINSITNAYRKVGRLGSSFRSSLIGQFVYAEGQFAPSNAPLRRAAGGSVMGNQPYIVGEFGPEMFVPSGSGSIRKASGTGDGVTIIMNGVIDGESARRSIERLLQNSARRTGAINLVGATL